MFIKILLIVLLILIIICSLVFVIYGVINYRVFNDTFKRKKCHSLLDVDLSKTHYAPHIEKIRTNIMELKGKLCKIVETQNDGLILRARYYNENSTNTVIMVHGYHAEAFNNFHASSKSFFNHGYNILMIDERAHNDSEGDYTTFGIKEQYDVLSWIRWVEANTNTKNIVLYGVSMGAATIGYLSNKLSDTLVKALIMDCGFTSFYDLVFYKEKKKKLLFLILFFLRIYGKMFLQIDIKKSTTDSLKESNVPVYFIHGAQDEMVPIEHTIANYNATSSDKRVHYVSSCGHTTAFLIDYDFLDKDLFGFINKYME